jgi:RNA polymerase sigma-70 factor, ECF subfamily
MSAELRQTKPALRLVKDKVTYSDLSDTDLILACQQKDAAAFNVLFKRYERYVHGLIFQMAPDWTNSREDLAQEVFIRIWRSIATLRNPNAFKGWLNQLITNLFYDELRKRPRFGIVSMDEPFGNDDEQGGTRDIPDHGSTPDELAHRHEIMQKVNEAIDTLPPQFKNVIILRELHGLPYEEIAALTKTEVGTVKSRIARARAKMQNQLNPLKIA